jgi:hypothetical protein
MLHHYDDHHSVCYYDDHHSHTQELPPMTDRRHVLAAFAWPLVLTACGTPNFSATSTTTQGAAPMTLESTQQALIGEWTSLAPEVRPSAQRNPDGSLKPFYLKRDFKALPGNRFELAIVNFADPYGKAPLARLQIKGHMAWRGEHAIAPGAQKVDFVADEAYEVTPLLQGFADVLNKVAAQGYAKWEVGQTQSIFGKSFAPFGLAAGTNFMEYDLVYLAQGMLFWGARNVDGRGFDTEQNRPTNLQIPLARR